MNASNYLSLIKAMMTDRPSTLTLFVTNRCNARCKMCFNWENIDKGEARKELTIDEISRIASGFRGLHALILSGGEPFLRDDLGKIISAFHINAGVRHVSIPTNLFCSDAPEKIREIAKRHPGIFFRILISVDGIGDDHDVIRGHVGGFRKLIANHERLTVYKKKLSNLSINFVTVMTSYNEDKMFDLLDFVGSLEKDDVKLIYVRGNPRDSKAAGVSPEKYLAAISHAERLSSARRSTKSFYNNLFSCVSLVSKELIAERLVKEPEKRKCNAGSKILVVYENGDVYPCEILGRRLGNLRKYNYDLSAVIRSREGQEVLNYIREGKCNCTMDCNTISDVIFAPSMYGRVLRKLIGLYYK